VATFMARWSAQEAGSSGHLHQSLWDLHQHANRFYDADDPQHCSSVLKQYVAGMVTLMPDVMAMVCPTINSYKRTVPGAWAPESATWGQENRTAAVRVIPGFSSSSTRAEYRLAGADANPYLALAASIGSGLYGIEASLELPPAVSGNAYESDAPRLPRTLEEAAGKLERSSVAAAMFGEEFIRHFVATRRWEVRQFQRAVTDWELRRYFEAI
jgi:glutamine synthetase